MTSARIWSTLSRIAAGLTAAVGAVVLTGSLLNSPSVASHGLPLGPTGAASALCLLMGGAAILLRGRRESRLGSFVAWTFAVAIAGIALASAAAELFHTTGGLIGRLVVLASDPAPFGNSLRIGRSPVTTTLPFLLIACAIVVLGRRRRSLFDLTTWAGLAVASFALHVLLSYPLMPAGNEGQMGPVTAFVFLILGTGIVATRLDAELVGVFRRGNPVGFVALRLLFVVLLMPPVLLDLQAWWLARRGGDLSSQTVFFTAISAIAFIGLLVVILHRMETLDQHRNEAEQARGDLLARLQQQAATLQFEVSERTFELKESTERLELAMSTAGCGVWDWDSSSNRAVWDDRQRAIYGLGPDSYDGSHGVWISRVHPDDREWVVATAHRDLKTGEHFERKYRIVTPTGQVRHIESKGNIRRDSSGKCIRIIGVDRDVTQEREAESALISAAERLRFALSSAGYGVWERDCTSERLVWDDRMLEIYGLRRADFAGTEAAWLRTLHPDDVPSAGNGSLNIRMGLAENYEDRYRIIRPDGSVRHIEARGFLKRSPEGNPLRIVGLNRDVTAETELREQLRITEERWQLALSGNNDGLWDWNVETSELYHDARYAEMLGYSRGEIPFHYSQWETRVHPDDKDAADAALAAHLAGQTSLYSSEYRMRHKLGHWVWILDRGKTVSRGSRGRPVRLVGTHTDISISKEIEGRLREFEDMSLQMGRLAQIGPWDWDLKTQRLTWSPEVHRIHHTDLGFEPTVEQMLGFYPGEARTRMQEALDTAVRLGIPFDLELPIVTAQHESRCVRILGKAESKDGATTRIYGAVQNITNIRESEEARRRLETQLFQAQKLETLGTLAGGIAHDFNNLLTGILGYQELALDGLESDSPARSCLEAAHGVSMRARGLVEQILTLSRQPNNEMATVDLTFVIEEAQRFLRTTVAPNIAIEADIAPGCMPVYAEATQIHQVLLNLGQNAAHAIGPAGGVIRVGLKPAEIAGPQAEALGVAAAGQYLQLSVSDTGHGMDAETQKRIFDPFFTTKGVGKGTGLGLSVVHGIVRAHRGSISVESAPGKGATFRIFLRCAENSDAEPGADDASLPRGNGELICIVDDEDFVLGCVAKAVDKLGYRTAAFDSPHKCLEALRGQQSECALLVTDQTMPGMTGTELAEHARSFAPKLPIIIMSGYFSKISPTILERMDHVSLVSKPFTSAELAQAIERSLSGDT
jgi:PAS domain S-box-containing protein